MNSSSLSVQKISNPSQMDLAWKIRKKVFVEEQEVDESMEWEHEEESTHFLAFIDGNAVGTARWRDSGKGIKLERFAVLSDYRAKGVGAALVEAVLADLPAGNRIYLHAQAAAEKFYARFGFKPAGPLFYEAGIAHYLMEMKPKD